MSFIKKNNGEGDRKPFFSRKNNNVSSTHATVSIMMIIALTLLPCCFVMLIPVTPMTITTVLAQQAEGDINTTNSTTGGTTTTTPSNFTITATTDATTNNATAALSPSTLHLSEQPIWQENAINTGVTPFNQTHSIVTFFGNGTLTVPDIGETINVTDNGTAFVSSVTGSGFGRESFFSLKDGDRTTITFHEILKNDPATNQTKGLTMAVFDGNATGSLAPFNGMIVVGLDDEQPGAGGVATKTLWLWESGIGNNNTGVVSSPPYP